MTHRLDLLVEGRVVVELKACKQIERVHFAVGPQLPEGHGPR
ncbi:GxxExxY protein [Myxococcota bacterium]